MAAAARYHCSSATASWPPPVHPRPINNTHTQQVWDNCREYNDPEAPVVADAAKAEVYWAQCWAATGVYVSPKELEMQQRVRRAAKAAAAAEKLESTWRGAARKVRRQAGVRQGLRPRQRG